MSQPAFQFILVVVVFLGFGTWPTVANKSQNFSAWYGMITSLVPALFFAIIGYKTLGDIPTGRPLAFQTLAGMINGIAVVIYVHIVSTPALKHLAAPAMIGSVATLSILAAHVNGHQILTPMRIAALITGAVSVGLFFKAG